MGFAGAPWRRVVAPVGPGRRPQLRSGSSVVLDGVARGPRGRGGRRPVAAGGGRPQSLVVMTTCHDASAARVRVVGRQRLIPNGASGSDSDRGEAPGRPWIPPTMSTSSWRQRDPIEENAARGAVAAHATALRPPYAAQHKPPDEVARWARVERSPIAPDGSSFSRKRRPGCSGIPTSAPSTSCWAWWRKGAAAPPGRWPRPEPGSIWRPPTRAVRRMTDSTVESSAATFHAGCEESVGRFAA